MKLRGLHASSPLDQAPVADELELSMTTQTDNQCLFEEIKLPSGHAVHLPKGTYVQAVHVAEGAAKKPRSPVRRRSPLAGR